MKDSTPSRRELLSSAFWLGLLGVGGSAVVVDQSDGVPGASLLAAFVVLLVGAAVVAYRGLGRARREAMPPTRTRMWHYVLPVSVVWIAGATSESLVNTLGAGFSGALLGIAVACAAEAGRLTRG